MVHVYVGSNVCDGNCSRGVWVVAEYVPPFLTTLHQNLCNIQCVFVCEREREFVCVCVCVREREREFVCVCV